MKRCASIVLSALAAAALLPGPVLATPSNVIVAPARAQQQHVKMAADSGEDLERIRPFSTIYAAMQFTDDGTTLTVSGSGRGFTPGLSYTSFFYGVGSVRKGSLACIPPTPNTLTALQMITAYWLPISGTNRTLYVQKTGTSYVSLSQVATFSVRYDTTPNLPLTTNLNPGRFWLNSCGRTA